MSADNSAAAGRTEVLPADVLSALVQDVAAPAPDEALVARVRARVAARTALDGAAFAFVNIAAHEGWELLAAGVERKVLFDDGRNMSFLVRLAAGVALPPHEHDGPEECLVLAGDLWLDDEHLAAGDYQLAQPGTRHSTIRSDHGCLVFARAPSSFAASVAIP